MNEEENIVDEGESDMNPSIFSESEGFVSELRVISKRKRGL